MSENRTEINSMGEFGLINHLTRNIELQNASTIVGVGDDAAIIDHFGKQTVITTDMLVEGIHFDRAFVPPRINGRIDVEVDDRVDLADPARQRRVAHVDHPPRDAVDVTTPVVDRDDLGDIGPPCQARGDRLTEAGGRARDRDDGPAGPP